MCNFCDPGSIKVWQSNWIKIMFRYVFRTAIFVFYWQELRDSMCKRLRIDAIPILTKYIKDRV